MSSSNNSEYRMLEIVAKKLGVNDANILKKASEFSRLTEAKSANQPLGLSASVQNIVSLELAANVKGITIDRNEAVKLSGIGKKSYLLHLYSVERLLNVQPANSVRDICIHMGCMELCQSAERLLTRHKENYPFADKEHPMYSAGALYAIAKQQKVSIDKKKLSELGRTRPSKLDILNTLMVKTLNQMGGVKKSTLKAPKNRSQTLLQMIADTKCSDESINSKCEETEENAEVDFEEWKKRMLAGVDPISDK